MEKSHHPSDTEAPEQIRIYLQGDILTDFSDLDLRGFELVSATECKIGVSKKNDKLHAKFADGKSCQFPYFKKNLICLLGFFSTSKTESDAHTETFNHLLQTTRGLEKKIYSNVSLAEGANVKDLWDGIIKKINSISNESQSLKILVEKILDIPFLGNFQSSLLFLHLKGQGNAELTGVLWRSEKVKNQIEVKYFNTFFNTIKKSKIKSFSTNDFLKLDLPFNGSFLAKDITSKKYSLVSIVSRHDFLDYTKEEAELFETCIDLLQPHFERLIDQEFSDKQISELRVCIKEFPLPVRLRDETSGASFLNDLYESDLRDTDIFFSKKIKEPFVLDLFDSDDLRHYAFDLFHFQRISLLGELLNTLRHELSNPLFGLKLGAQIFATMEASSESKEIMTEVEKNIDRSQAIIENFSNLYQVQSEKKPTSIKKMIDEAMVLAKSELRDIKKLISYSHDTDRLLSDAPLIFVVQIIFNLVINSAQAMKNMESPRRIQILVECTHDKVRIDVIDDGPGIDPEMARELFKPFFTTKSQGTGLGLILSRNLALKMGGNLEYLSAHQNNGTCFRLTLPK